jgi:phosphoribosyl-ATP pyrophosphohydrolase/phosphoribosyl-AMP cyclohydrolase/histidinol dehydrogenase
MPRLFAHLPFLALVQLDDQGQLPDEELLLPISRIAPLLVPAPALKTVLQILPRTSEYWCQVTEDVTADVAIALLDAGAAKVVTSNVELFAHLPADRLVLALDEDSMDVLADDEELAGLVQSVLLEVNVTSKGFDKQLVSTARSLMGGKGSRDAKDLFVLPMGETNPTFKHLEQLSGLKMGTTPCLPTSILSADVPPVSTDGTVLTSLPMTSSQSKAFHLPIDLLFLSSLTTDRPDNLYATLVSASNEPPLGLVYSSPLSISMSILTAQATYFSRSRQSLWVKGATSGATQQVVAIRRDCDGDALEFVVEQKTGTGFCHTLRASSCFGPASGTAALEATLQERKQNAPTGSYTKRLFEDAPLLEAKLREEAEEVCQAKSWEETRLEAADLLYFLMVRRPSASVLRTYEGASRTGPLRSSRGQDVRRAGSPGRPRVQGDKTARQRQDAVPPRSSACRPPVAQQWCQQRADVSASDAAGQGIRPGQCHPGSHDHKVTGRPGAGPVRVWCQRHVGRNHSARVRLEGARS